MRYARLAGWSFSNLHPPAHAKRPRLLDRPALACAQDCEPWFAAGQLHLPAVQPRADSPPDLQYSVALQWDEMWSASRRRDRALVNRAALRRSGRLGHPASIPRADHIVSIPVATLRQGRALVPRHLQWRGPPSGRRGAPAQVLGIGNDLLQRPDRSGRHRGWRAGDGQ